MCRRTTIVSFDFMFCRPLFHVTQDDNKMFWGVRGGGVDQWGGGGPLSPKEEWPCLIWAVFFGCFWFSSGDLSVLWIGRGTVGRWPWACVLVVSMTESPEFQ